MRRKIAQVMPTAPPIRPRDTEEFRARLQKSGGSMVVVVPAWVVHAMQAKKGEEVEITISRKE